MITDAMIDAAMDALAPDLFGREQMRAALIAAERAAWVEPPNEVGPWLYVTSNLHWTGLRYVWGPWINPNVRSGAGVATPSDENTRRRVRRLPEMPE